MCKKFDFGSLSVLAVVGGSALLAFEFGPPVVPPACRLHPTKLSLIPVKNPLVMLIQKNLVLPTCDKCSKL